MENSLQFDSDEYSDDVEDFELDLDEDDEEDEEYNPYAPNNEEPENISEEQEKETDNAGNDELFPAKLMMESPMTKSRFSLIDVFSDDEIVSAEDALIGFDIVQGE